MMEPLRLQHAKEQRDGGDIEQAGHLAKDFEAQGKLQRRTIPPEFQNLKWQDTFFDGLALDGRIVAVFDMDYNETEKKLQRGSHFLLVVSIFGILTGLMVLQDDSLFLGIFELSLSIFLLGVAILTFWKKGGVKENHLAVTTEGIVVHRPKKLFSKSKGLPELRTISFDEPLCVTLLGPDNSGGTRDVLIQWILSNQPDTIAMHAVKRAEELKNLVEALKRNKTESKLFIHTYSDMTIGWALRFVRAQFSAGIKPRGDIDTDNKSS